MKQLAISPVETMLEAQEMRRIRNGVAGFMTHNRNPIRDTTQAFWFEEIYKPAHADNEMHAFLGRVDDAPVAYGLVSRRQGTYWVSGGLKEAFRGNGLGEELFQHLTDFTLEHCAEVVYLDVFADNAPAVCLYHKLGYEETAHEGTLIVMRKEASHEPVVANV